MARYFFNDSKFPENRTLTFESASIRIQYTNEDLQRLIDGPTIPIEYDLRMLPPDLREHLRKMRHYQQALRRQGSTHPILPPDALPFNG